MSKSAVPLVFGSTHRSDQAGRADTNAISNVLAKRNSDQRRRSVYL